MQRLMQSLYTFRQNRPLELDLKPLRLTRLGWLVALTALVVLASGCATQGDLLRLQEKVAENHRSDRDSPDPFARIAKLSTDVDALRQEVRDLQGELELASREATQALEEARRTRTEIARGAPIAGSEASKAPTGATGSADSGVGGAAAAGIGGDSAPAPDEELAGYQGALDAWRADDFNGCIEQFTSFL